jgi:hypothetical protein
MLLRRVIRHVTDQNWVAVIIDFLIVVVGIFVGLQVQSWSVQQAEYKQERIYLERILSDVNRSISVNEYVAEFNSKPIDDVWVVYQSLKNCRLPEDQKDQFANGLSNIGKFIRSSYLMGTAKEMLSAGHFGLIRNLKIRDLINQLADSFEYDQVLFPAINTRLGPSLAYLDQQTAISKRTFGMAQEVPITWSDVEIEFETLCKDRKYLGALSMTRDTRELFNRRNINALALFQKTRLALIDELRASPQER